MLVPHYGMPTPRLWPDGPAYALPRPSRTDLACATSCSLDDTSLQELRFKPLEAEPLPPPLAPSIGDAA
jgi:hypothetical protein